MQSRSTYKRVPGLTFVLVVTMLFVLWLAGGASRADVAGQAIVRAAAAGCLVIHALFGRRTPDPTLGVPGAILGAACLLALVQLIPLPPQLWRELPGRESFAAVDLLAGGAAWRPLSLVPGATLNALFSLLVPISMLMLVSSLNIRERNSLTSLLLYLLVASMLVGLIQFSGTSFRFPFINGSPGMINGVFANRNHFALSLAIGILLLPVWVFASERRQLWRAPIGAGLTVLFALTILSTGSRAGMALGVLALVLATLLVRRTVVTKLRGRRRWVPAALVGGTVALLVISIGFSVVADRAKSLDRALELSAGQDMRARGLPVMLDMVRTYLPWGSGLGGFDPLFRLHEPFHLLKPTYFNHAHNDWLEVVLDAGLPGAAILVAALGWWILASARAWRATHLGDPTMPRLGSAILLLVMLASVVDYPARTPTIMAIVVVAAVWLSGPAGAKNASALPGERQHI